MRLCPATAQQQGHSPITMPPRAGSPAVAIVARIVPSPASGSVFTEIPRCTVALNVTGSAYGLTIVLSGFSDRPEKIGCDGSLIDKLTVPTVSGMVPPVVNPSRLFRKR